MFDNKTKNTVAAALLILFLVSLTASAASAFTLQSSYKNNPTLQQISQSNSAYYLKMGSHGDAVTLVQRTLMKTGYEGCGLPKYGADGSFGTEAKKAVQNYQAHYGLSTDGIIGPTTLYYLDLDQKRIESGQDKAVKLNVAINNAQIKVSDSGGNDHFTPAAATITITVKDSDGIPMPNTKVRVKAITVPGSGGHTHDINRSPESQGKRPRANLAVSPVSLVNQIDKNDIIAKTDNSGKVVVTYKPPSVKVGRYTRAVAGTDRITTILPDTKISDVKYTNVGYLGFVKLTEDADVSLISQKNHAKEFYCTQDTFNSIRNIASKFRVDTRAKVRITATSLPWGGLLDIDGTWKNPHVEHQNGKCVDFGFGTFDNDKRKKLINIIMNDPNFQNFAPGEDKITSSHLHARFKK